MSSEQPPAPETPEPDPFRNARGLNAIFGSSNRKGPPLWPFMLAAVGILGVLVLRIELASREARDRDLDFQLAREIAGQNHSGALPLGDGRGVGDRSLGGSPILEDFTKRAKEVCGRLAACNGGDANSKIADNCVKQDLDMAKDPLTLSLMKPVLDDVMASCGPKPCEEFNDCYFDRLKKLSVLADPTQAPASEADKARVEELVCKIGLAYARRPPPDLNGPDASPDMRELSALITKIGPTAAADVVKDAVKHCVPNAGTERPSGSSSSSSAHATPSAPAH